MLAGIIKTFKSAEVRHLVFILLTHVSLSGFTIPTETQGEQKYVHYRFVSWYLVRLPVHVAFANNSVIFH